MRSIAEERRLGTLEALLTAPVSPRAVVLAKFLAAYALLLGLWLTTLLHPAVAAAFAGAAPLHDWGAITAGYIFTAASGLLFIAIGILASALVRTQVIAAIGAFVGLFTLLIGGRYAIDWLSGLGEANQALIRLLRHAQPFEHAESFGRGVIDLGAIAFYVTTTAALLHIAALAVEIRSVRR
jgi:ABC-2 type transport system permease protein